MRIFVFPIMIMSLALLLPVADAEAQLAILGYGAPQPVAINNVVNQAAARGDPIVWESPAVFSARTDFSSFDLIYVPHNDFQNGPIDYSGLVANSAWHDGSGGKTVGSVILTGLHAEHHLEGLPFINNVLDWMNDGNAGTIGIFAFWNFSSVAPFSWLPGADIVGTNFNAFSDAIRVVDPNHPVTAGLTDNDMSNWGDSAHQVYNVGFSP